MADERLKSIIRAEMDTCIGLSDGKLSGDRDALKKAYYGEPYDVDAERRENGWSTYVDRTVMETVEWAKGPLLRVFAGAEELIRFEPAHPEEEEYAREATDYVNKIVFGRNAFDLVYGPLTDGLYQRVGWAKAHFEEKSARVVVQELEGLTAEEAEAVSVMAEAGGAGLVVDIERRRGDEGGGTYRARISKEKKERRIAVTPIPSERVIYSSDALSVENARFIAHWEERMVGEMIAEGYPADLVEGLPSGVDDIYPETRFPDTGAAVAVAGALTGMDLLVFTERAIHRGQYVGSPYIFQFDVLDKGRGAIAPASVVTGNSAVYFLSENGFFATDGSGVKNIGFERVNGWFRSKADDGRRFEVRGAADPVTGVIFWTFAGPHAPAGIHDHVLVYHPMLDRWSHAEDIESVGIFTGLTRPKTLEDLDAIADMENLPYSLDSRVWKGGVPGLAGFAPDNRLSWFLGSPCAAVIDTAETGGRRMMIHGIRPLVEGAKAEAAVLHRDFTHEQVMERACAPVSAMDGVAYTHISTRYARARVSIPAGVAWKFAMGCEMLMEEEGGL